MSTVRLHANGIPLKVLEGKVKGFTSVHHIYKKIFYTRFMEILHKSYYDRAFWGTDEFGQRWTVLHRRTDEIKNELQDSGDVDQPQLSGNFPHKRYLSPDQFKQFKDNYRANIEAGKAPRTAHRHSLKDIDTVNLGSRVSFDGTVNIPRTPINIRTGRLAAAFSPGEVANNRIYGGPDQNFRLDGLNFHFDVNNVPYADEVQQPIKRGSGVIQRLLITDKHSQGLQRAHNEAIVAARKEYDDLVAKQKRGKKTNDNRKTDNSSRR